MGLRLVSSSPSKSVVAVPSSLELIFGPPAIGAWSAGGVDGQEAAQWAWRELRPLPGTGWFALIRDQQGHVLDEREVDPTSFSRAFGAAAADLLHRAGFSKPLATA